MTPLVHPITTDEAYSTAARDALVRLYEWFTNPGQLLSADQQERFISTAIHLITPIVDSEPHLRGAVISATDKMAAFDKENELKEAQAIATALQQDVSYLADFEVRAMSLKPSDIKGMRALVRDLKHLESKRTAGSEHA